MQTLCLDFLRLQPSNRVVAPTTKPLLSSQLAYIARPARLNSVRLHRA